MMVGIFLGKSIPLSLPSNLTSHAYLPVSCFKKFYFFLQQTETLSLCRTAETADFPVSSRYLPREHAGKNIHILSKYGAAPTPSNLAFFYLKNPSFSDWRDSEEGLMALRDGWEKVKN